MKEIEQIAQDCGVSIVEDCSHAHGAVANGRTVGSIGRIGSFSLQGAKAIAAGEGGIAVTSNKSDFLRMSAWGHFDRHRDDFAEFGLSEFQRVGFGNKRRMAPLSALMAQADLDEIHRLNAIMNKTASRLDQALSGISGVTLPQLPFESRRGGFYCGYAFSAANASNVIARLKTIGIHASGYPFPLHHQMPVYTDLLFRQRAIDGAESAASSSPSSLPNTEALSENLVLIARRHLVTLSNAKIKKIARLLEVT